ncbi:MAG: helix-turn-helix transcriptional regulator [Steroidobacteraceae bacterium]
MLRKTRGLTSEKLAYENDMSKGYLSRIENGKRLPTLSFLNKLAKALDYELWQFFVSQKPALESSKLKKGRSKN